MNGADPYAQMESGVTSRATSSRDAYEAPVDVTKVDLFEVLARTRPIPQQQQARLGGQEFAGRTPKLELDVAGDVSLFQRPAVAVVGTRKPSPEGAARARRLARELTESGVVVVSGLAEGVDFNAHTAAIAASGSTIAVIGTPIDQVYPAAHRRLQEQIYREFLLVSQFRTGSRVFQSNFPARNKVMAALTDATVIVEAGETSGTLHQAAECQRLGRWLFIAKSLFEPARKLTWPSKFLAGYSRTRVLVNTSEVVDAIGAER